MMLLKKMVIIPTLLNTSGWCFFRRLRLSTSQLDYGGVDPYPTFDAPPYKINCQSEAVVNIQYSYQL